MEKRESLTARYERVLGRSLPDIDTEDSQHEAADTTNPSKLKRREQVLNAQRTHRHRTQQYIRELEKEVFRLRDENDELQQAMDRIRIEMARMSVMLSEKGHPFDATTDDAERHQQRQRPEASNNAQRTTAQTTTAPLITVDLTSIAHVFPQGSCENHPAELNPPSYQPYIASQAGLHEHRAQHDPPSDAQGNQLTAQTGINFVLALEAPCLPHIKHAHMGYTTATTPRGITYNSGPGHILNASAMLVHQFHKQQDLEHTPLTLPSLDVERLLAASSKLKLDGEVTPVQIWKRVRELDRGGRRVGKEEVDDLVQRLEVYVYCNSFGAVVEKATLEAVFAEWAGGDAIQTVSRQISYNI